MLPVLWRTVHLIISLQRFYQELVGIDAAPGLVSRVALWESRWANMPRLMEQFGVTVVTGGAPPVAARDGEALAVAARDVAGDSGNGDAPIVAAMDDVGNFGAVAGVLPNKRKLDAQDDFGDLGDGEAHAMAAGDSTSDAGEVAQMPPGKRKRGDEGK